ncbi:MAG TPA: hypothetical protein VKT81_13125 [Bryobacteraceae bacterium]|nr:hypothetical protein [Bryobacteraceae bacterium]
MKKLLIALFVAGALLAQDRVQKVVTIKNGNRNGILHTLQELAPTNGMVITTSDADHLILSGPKDTVAGFEEIVKQLDIPPIVKKDIETTVYMVVASTQSANATSLPAELDPVAKQLKNIFNYKGFRLLESFVLRSRDGEGGGTDGFLPAAENVPAGHKISYHYDFRHVSLEGTENAKVAHFDHLALLVKVPIVMSSGEVYPATAKIDTDVDVPEGKKVVVGKTSALEGSDGALILVISAKVVD